MPELPEVETTRRGIAPLLEAQRIHRVIVREPRLRWPVPANLKQIKGLVIAEVSRRAKYLLLRLERGTVLWHLGMSGSLRVVPHDTPPQTHDHLDIELDNGNCLRYRDPRRFGCCLYTQRPVEQHRLIRDLGPEPLSAAFDSDYLYQASRRRRIHIKPFIMNSQIVVGVGNIYANEALFSAQILPGHRAEKLSDKRYARLVTSIKSVLAEAIKYGGTTLQDFSKPDGKPGYFRNRLAVYARNGLECERCGDRIKLRQQAQRATYYCTGCQY